MNKPETILTDTEMHALICGNPSTLGLSIARLKDFIRQVEKAVVAKLAEQEPVAWRITAKQFCGDTTKHKDTADYWEKREPRCVTPLYAHPMPSSQGFLDNSNHIPDGSKLVGLSLSVDTKKAQALLQSYLDSLEGWQLVPKEPARAMVDQMQIQEEAGFYEMYYAALAAAPKFGDKQ